MFKLKGAAEFNDGLDKWLKEVKQESQEVFRGLAVEAFNYLIHWTPQWTGNAVYNWNFSVGQPDDSVDTSLKREFEDLVHDKEPFQRGSERAKERASQRNSGRDEIVEGFPSYFISNNAESISGESYIFWLENNPNGFLRPENEPGHMVANFKAIFETRGALSDAWIKNLKTKRIGNFTQGFA